ncbi:MAG: ABC transporter ATP-binding protein, partial [Coprobacillus sp.]|nr:ABC transporter ATP-binding protein [Coprobacillus sp.]
MIYIIYDKERKECVMLKLEGITKDYVSKGQPTVNALKGIDISLRRSEFVAILGQSGCGKTTLLNIVGGLDRYTEGDLIINGKSTKDYKDGDWDTYRNHSVGFVFQSYNLIPHISILRNVEMALIIGGVDKKTRRERAMAALKEVGLEGLEKKRPNQLSGGQMQRVAIARAIVNDPEIILADEPTGALDTETSIQVMDILKELSKDRLIVMVTHNPDLAEKYATRIVRMSDGVLVSDSDPYADQDYYKDCEVYLEELAAKQEEENASKTKRQIKREARNSRMSFGTSLGLSMNNLVAKKGRTTLVAIASSIGIIGIALVLSVSNGFNGYIQNIQTEALSTYPLTISKNNTDIMSLMTGIMGSMGDTSGVAYPDDDVVGMDTTTADLLDALVASNNQSDTASFKKYVEQDEIKEEYMDSISAIAYSYDAGMHIYLKQEDGSAEQVIPLDLTKGDYTEMQLQYVYQFTSIFSSYLSMIPIFEELMPNWDTINYPERTYNEIIESQYDLMAGEWPSEITDVVIVVNEYNRLDDYQLIGMGLQSAEPLIVRLLKSYMDNADEIFPGDYEPDQFSATYDDLLALDYYIPMAYELYDFNQDLDENKDPIDPTEDALNGYYSLKEGDELEDLLYNDESTIHLNVCGILRPKQGTSTTSISGCVGYSPYLTEYIINEANNSVNYEGYDSVTTNPIVAQQTYETIDVLTGEGFTDTTASANLTSFGVADLSTPETIYIYPKSFDSKDKIYEMIGGYDDFLREQCLAENPLASEQQISRYIDEHTVMVNDTISSLMDVITMIVNAVTYVLIAFVSIS